MRPRRALYFGLAASVSMAALLATGILWARSTTVSDVVSYAGRWTGLQLAPADGQLYFWRWTTDDPSMMAKVLPTRGWVYSTTPPWSIDALRLQGGTLTSQFEFAGLHFYHHVISVAPARNEYAYVVIPAWHFITATSLLPLAWVASRRRARRERRRRQGLCEACGYDLRASPTRCPECGRTPVRSREVASPPPSA